MLHDTLYLLGWWLALLIIGLIFFSASAKIFAKFFDKGYLFSKTLGLAISSYSIWLLSSLHVVPFTRASIIICLAIFLIILNARHLKFLLETLKTNYKIIIFEEFLFLGSLGFWAYIRAHQPEIDGLEKFMDFGFVNTILRTKYLPPKDMWFAGNTINYYYYGHYVAAFLTKLTNINSAITYNLMIATLFALTFSLGFSLSGNLINVIHKNNFTKIITGGFISAFLLSLGANLHTFIFAYVYPLAKKIGLFHGSISNYWYPDATRFIGYNPPTNDKTIHEFPNYSFVVSDLHAHVSSMPFVITLLALLLAIMIGFSQIEKKNDYDYKLVTVETFLISLLLGIFYMTNTWDFPIYLLAASLVLLIVNLRHKVSLIPLIYTVIQILIIILTSLILILPFILTFKNLTSGIALVHSHTPLRQFLVLWGYQLFLVVLFVIISSLKHELKLAKASISHLYVVILSGVAIILLLIPEIIYVKDIYAADYYRANTMFKFTYQAFIIFALLAGYIVVHLWQTKLKTPWLIALRLFLAIVIILPMLYPFWSITGYYGNITRSNYQGLYGLNFIKKPSPDSYNAIQWLNQNVAGQPNIVESYGDSYSENCRISMATGLPTIIGWHVHEWLWRGSDVQPTAREGEVDQIYQSDNLATTKSILNKYQVKYLIVSELERSKYPKISETTINKLGKKAFTSGSTYIIQIN